MNRSLAIITTVFSAFPMVGAWACNGDGGSGLDGGADADSNTDSGTDSDSDGDSDSDSDTDASYDPACDTECGDGSWEIHTGFVFPIEQVDAGEPPPCELSYEDVDFNDYPCNWLDPAYVTVHGDDEQIPYSSDFCAEGSGWWLWFVSEIDGPPAELRICGEPCESIQNGEWSEITVQMWSCVF